MRLPTLLLAASLSIPMAAPAAPRKPAHKAAPAPSYAQRPEIASFAAEMLVHHGMDPEWVKSQLAQAHRLAVVERLIMPPPPGTAKNWQAYKARFVEAQRIAAGLAFWQANADWLELAEARWGVPPHIVAGIIGVETFYGRHTGGFRVIDALATLAFDFPAGRKNRSEFFRGELEEFFVLCARDGTDPQGVKGSYAGALGLPQFMPGSVNRFALDFDEDGRIDLQRSAADAIGSVAHYLAAFGWQRDLPTHYEVAVPVDSAERAALLVPDILPSFTPAQFIEMGALLPEAGTRHDGLLALVELQNGSAAPSYVAGTSNFYAITRYNWSAYYAMAVIELGEALKRRR